MYRLGIGLILKGGRETRIRLLITTLVVAVAVIILLGVFADFHAFEKTSSRPSWESTSGSQINVVPGNAPNALLWNYSENIYKGQFIEELNLAALGPNAPLLPGVPKLPGPGQFYASPELARLLKTVPKDQLGDRFQGVHIGTIGEAALSFPTELAIFEGNSPSRLARQPGTILVRHIATVPQLQGTTNIYKDAFGIAAVAVLFPLLILVNTATKLSATRREERFAAMRLVGATPGQINVIASVDAIMSAFFGTVLGSLSFVALQPAIADLSFSGVKFFPNYVTPTVGGYVGMIVGVPIIAAIASLISLRRIRISPLGVSRKATPKKPRSWRLMPLIAGAILFPYAATTVGKNSGNGSGPWPLVAGFLLIMIGIVLSGSWLTMQTTKVLSRLARSAPSLLAARRLSDNPKGAFRVVSGLVLAVFVGSVISVLVPALNQAQSPSGETSLNKVLRVPFTSTSALNPGISPAAASALVRKMESYPGTVVVPLYTNPAYTSYMQKTVSEAQAPVNLGRNRANTIPIARFKGPNLNPPNDNIASCASLSKIKALGSCPSGAKEVTLSADNVLSGDNPLGIYKSLPMVRGSNPVTTANLNDLYLSGLLIKPNNANTLEQIRTFLTVYETQNLNISGRGNNLTSWQMGEFEPETVGEVAAIRNNDVSNVGRAVMAIIALTLITAGCSMAVTVGGSLVERKRPFTLLRVSGASLGTLYRVILLEAALPLIVISIFAAGLGLGTGIPVVRTLIKSLEPKGPSVPIYPSADYYIALGVGLVVAIGVVIITLPILKRMTKPEDARFE